MESVTVTGEPSVLSSAVPIFVSSPSLGGGLPGPVPAAARKGWTSTTPPISPYQEASLNTGESLITFSPQLCLALLDGLTDEQVDFERAYLAPRGVDFASVSGRTLRPRDRTTSTSKDVIRSHLQSSLNQAFTDSVHMFHSLTQNFSCLMKRLESTAAVPVRSCTVSESPVTAPATPPKIETPAAAEFDNTVFRMLDSVSFADMTVSGALQQLEPTVLDRTGSGRFTAYFGKLSYGYGNTKHKACSYPTCDLVSSFFERLSPVVPDFNADTFTCLVTHYPDGRAGIPLHSDDEAQIVPDSDIITISIGSPRVLTLQNQEGVLNETTVPLPHGSVYAMSRASQATWKHAIRADSSVSAPRLSFTFRRLVHPDAILKRPRAPPIQHPDLYRSPNALPVGTHDRILLLTDSILAATPPSIFDRVGKSTCIKKICKELVNIQGFEPEFAYTKTVIISAGVNDLSCYGKKAHVLADMVCHRLANWCKKYPHTTFIFNSLLETGIKWLNSEIDSFNRIMHDLSLQHVNLMFFDSHCTLVDDPISNRRSQVLDPDDPRRVHITRDARIVVNNKLVDAVEFLSCKASARSMPMKLRSFRWPLRWSFTGAGQSPSPDWRRDLWSAPVRDSRRRPGPW